MPSRVIYLDNNATTQPTRNVVDAMLPYMTECYFNASASTAAFTGADRPRREAARAMTELLNAEDPECFTFTSGATESNNWVLFSVNKRARARHVLISAIEHASIAEPAAELSRCGCEIIEVPVDTEGVVRMDLLHDILTQDITFASIMAANNETGVLQPIAKIGQLIHQRCPTALFHTDATQVVGKIEIDLQQDWEEVDFLSFSAHKFHGPKGIGGLYIRPGLELEPMLMGGGQERGFRSGTINTPSLAGLAAAAFEARSLELETVRILRDTFEDRLLDALPEAAIHSRHAPRLPNTSSFSLPGTFAEDIVELLAAGEIIVGSGAACSSGAIRSSKTLQAMGVPHEIATAALRVSLSRFSSIDEVTDLVVNLTTIYKRIASARTDPAHVSSAG